MALGPAKNVESSNSIPRFGRRSRRQRGGSPLADLPSLCDRCGMTASELWLAKGVSKMAMRAFLGLLVVNALVAIAAILGAAGDFNWQVVGTTLLLTAGCFMIAANAVALERDRLMQLPYVGAALSCIAFGVFIFLIWVEPSSASKFVLKSTFIVLTLGLAATYASVLAVPRLAGVFSTARLVAYATVALLAGITIGVIVAEAGDLGQVYAVLSVVLATATIIVLTGAVIESRKPSGTPAAATSLVQSGGMYCPACGSAMATSVLSTTHACSHCGLCFTLDITSPPAC